MIVTTYCEHERDVRRKEKIQKGDNSNCITRILNVYLLLDKIEILIKITSTERESVIFTKIIRLVLFLNFYPGV